MLTLGTAESLHSSCGSKALLLTDMLHNENNETLVRSIIEKR